MKQFVILHMKIFCLCLTRQKSLYGILSRVTAELDRNIRGLVNRKELYKKWPIYFILYLTFNPKPETVGRRKD